jgi:hypothetical protein
MKRFAFIILFVFLLSAAGPLYPESVQDFIHEVSILIKPPAFLATVEPSLTAEVTEVFPSPTVMEVIKTALPTNTPEAYPAPVKEETEVPTVQVTEQPTMVPTIEPTVQPTATSMFENLKPLTGGEIVPFGLQSVSPVFIVNFANIKDGCNWMGIAGQVFDNKQLPVDGLVVVVEGIVDGKKVESLGFTGLSLAYGPAGYEVILGNASVSGEFWLQLFDQNGKPLSDIYAFETPGGCEQNLGILNFNLKITEYEKFMPTIE